MLRVRLLVEAWIGRVFWYCANGVTVMQSTGNGVCGLPAEFVDGGTGPGGTGASTHKVCHCVAPPLSADVISSSHEHG